MKTFHKPIQYFRCKGENSKCFFPRSSTQNFIFGLAIFNLRKFGENEAITSIPPDPRAVSSKMHMIGVRFMFGIRYQCGPLFGQKGAHP